MRQDDYEKVDVGSQLYTDLSTQKFQIFHVKHGFCDVIGITSGGPGGDMNRSTGTWYKLRFADGTVIEEHNLSLWDNYELVEEMYETDGKHYADTAIEVIENINNELRRLANGPASYYFRQVRTYTNALFDRFAPFKTQDIVRLKEDIPVKKDSGWYGSRHFLKKGELARVHSVDYQENEGFVADCQFFNESWIDMEGNKRPIENNRRHVFSISEKWLEKVEEE